MIGLMKGWHGRLGPALAVITSHRRYLWGLWGIRPGTNANYVQRDKWN